MNLSMADLKSFSPEILAHVAQSLSISQRGLIAVIELLDEGGTVLFIARYRKEATGNFNEIQILAIEEELAYFRDLAPREAILASLDMSAVHPEFYPVVEQMAQSLGVPIEKLIQHPQLLEKVDSGKLPAGAYTLNDILEELRKPGRDPRDSFVAPAYNDEVRETADVQPGMLLEGVVTNGTKFGAFVDIGVHQDGLVHVSELSHRYIREPAEVVKAGQIVKVKMLNADTRTKRIALSIKALHAPAAPRPKPKTTLDDKLAALSSKWKVRSG